MTIPPPANENIVQDAIRLPDIVAGSARFAFYQIPGQGLIIDSKDIEKFFSRNDLTPELVLAVKEETERRIHARLQQVKGD